jgi:hypothetical protein
VIKLNNVDGVSFDIVVKEFIYFLYHECETAADQTLDAEKRDYYSLLWFE